jgi:hypothetical protein
MLKSPKSASWVELYDAVGNLRLTLSVDKETIRIPADKLNPGIYLYLVKDANTRIIDSGKCVKE